MSSSTSKKKKILEELYSEYTFAIKEKDYLHIEDVSAEILKYDPKSPLGYLGLGVVNAEVGELETAKKYFLKALSLSKKVNLPSLVYLGLIHMVMGTNQGIQYAKKAYNIVKNMDHDTFIGYLEKDFLNTISYLIILLGSLKYHDNIINLHKKFGEFLFMSQDRSILINVAVAYANVRQFDTALKLLESYGSEKFLETSKAYMSFIKFLKREQLKMSIDYVISSYYKLKIKYRSQLRTYLKDLPDYFRDLIPAYHSKTEIAGIILWDEPYKYEKTYLIEGLVAIARNEKSYLELLRQIFFSKGVPEDIKLSIYFSSLYQGVSLINNEEENALDPRIKKFITRANDIYSTFVKPYKDKSLDSKKLLTLTRKHLRKLKGLHDDFNLHIIYLHMLRMLENLVFYYNKLISKASYTFVPDCNEMYDKEKLFQELKTLSHSTGEIAYLIDYIFASFQILKGCACLDVLDLIKEIVSFYDDPNERFRLRDVLNSLVYVYFLRYIASEVTYTCKGLDDDTLGYTITEMVYSLGTPRLADIEDAKKIGNLRIK